MVVAVAGIADLLGWRGCFCFGCLGLGWIGLRWRWFRLSRVGERVVTSRACFRFGSGERHDIHGWRGVAALGEDFSNDLADLAQCESQKNT